MSHEKLAAALTNTLGFPLGKVEPVARRRQLDDGRTTVVEMNVVRPATWSFRSAAVMADIAAKLSALLFGTNIDFGGATYEQLVNSCIIEQMPAATVPAHKA
jgi:hypothetical protein